MTNNNLLPVDAYDLTRLPNGATVVSVTVPHTLAASYSILLQAGSRYEPEPVAGISHFVEHIVFKGTQGWPSARSISQAIEGVGGSLNASTGRELVTYWARVPEPKFDEAVSVISSLVTKPIIDGAEVQKERGVILEEISMARDDPHARIGMISDEVTYPAHPLGRDIAGTPDSLANIEQADLVAYMDMHYVPSSVVVAVASNRAHEDVVAAVSTELGDWKPDAPAADREKSFGMAHGQAVQLEKWSGEQANFVLTMPGIEFEDPDRWALSLMNVILGDGMSSRLFQRIREELALAYSVYSFPIMHSDQGVFGVYSGVSPDRAEQALSAVIDELGRFESTVTSSELDRAREYVRGRLLLGTEDTRGAVQWVGRQLALTGKIITIEQTLAAIDAVTVEDLQRVANRIVRPEDYRLAVLGPFDSAEGFKSLLKQLC